MRLHFCADPLNPRAVDADYESEASAASVLGIEHELISFEAMVNERDPVRAVRRVREPEHEEAAIYRGWMLTVAQYAALHEALAARNLRLLNDPAAYQFCHYLPDSYPAIKGRTPRTVWTRRDSSGPDFEQIMEALRPFGSGPVIVKGFVKSRKHEWFEACFIPSAADRAAVERVVRRFIELQGEDLAEGLVFREFVEFEPLGTHSRSGMPLTREYRLSFVDGEPVSVLPYWDEGDYAGPEPLLGEFRAIAAKVPSRFFTMDVARTVGGNWLIVELGDGQVAGLPDHADVGRFYHALSSRLHRRNEP
jgi:hypothetical protein